MASLLDIFSTKFTNKDNVSTAGGGPTALVSFGGTGGGGGSYAYNPQTDTRTTTTTSDSRSYQYSPFTSSVYSPSVTYILNSSGASGYTGSGYSASPSANLTPSTNLTNDLSGGGQTGATGSGGAGGLSGIDPLMLLLLGGAVIGGAYLITRKRK